MKILMLCKKFPYPLKDGEAIAIFNNIKGFHDCGHETTVLAINTRKHHFDSRQLPVEVKALATFHAVDVDTNVTYTGAFRNLFSGTPYHVSRFWSHAFAEKLKGLLQSEKFDLIQCEGLYLSAYMDVIREYSKAPVVMRSHNVEFEIWKRIAANSINVLKRIYLLIQARRLKKYELEQAKRYDAIVPISIDDEQKYRELGVETPLYASPSGIDLDRYQLTDKPPEPNSLCFIGSLDWQPNQEGVMWLVEQVWPLVRLQRPEAQLYIAGRNMPEAVKHMHVKGVKMIGEVDDALDFIRSKAVMLVPLFSGSGMRIKIVEGMALGRPVISTHIGAEGIPAENREEIIIADSAEDFAKAIIRCLAGPKEAGAIGKNARRFIETHYDNRKFAAALLHFYAHQFQL